MNSPSPKSAHTPLEHLALAAKRDAEKGGGGLRSTREIADYCGWSLASTRIALWKLERAGKVDAFSGEGFGGGPIYWGHKDRATLSSTRGQI